MATLDETIHEAVQGRTRSGNGTKKLYAAIGTALLIAFLSFTTYRVYIYTPECLDKKADKAEVKELRAEFLDGMKELRTDVKEILRRLP